MKLDEELKFFNQVAEYVKDDPKNLEKIISIGTRAIVSQSKQVRAHACAMEAVAASALNARLFKSNKKFIADTLESWAFMNSLRWDDQLTELRK